MEQLLKTLQGNADWGDRTLLDASQAREIVNHIQRLNDTIAELKDEVRGLECEVSDAWAQVLHG